VQQVEEGRVDRVLLAGPMVAQERLEAGEGAAEVGAVGEVGQAQALARVRVEEGEDPLLSRGKRERGLREGERREGSETAEEAATRLLAHSTGPSWGMSERAHQDHPGYGRASREPRNDRPAPRRRSGIMSRAPLFGLRGRLPSCSRRWPSPAPAVVTGAQAWPPLDSLVEPAGPADEAVAERSSGPRSGPPPVAPLARLADVVLLRDPRAEADRLVWFAGDRPHPALAGALPPRRARRSAPSSRPTTTRSDSAPSGSASRAPRPSPRPIEPSSTSR
jgi:hypothetical protein